MTSRCDAAMPRCCDAEMLRCCEKRGGEEPFFMINKRRNRVRAAANCARGLRPKRARSAEAAAAAAQIRISHKCAYPDRKSRAALFLLPRAQQALPCIAMPVYIHSVGFASSRDANSSQRLRALDCHWRPRARARAWAHTANANNARASQSISACQCTASQPKATCATCPGEPIVAC